MSLAFDGVIELAKQPTYASVFKCYEKISIKSSP